MKNLRLWLNLLTSMMGKIKSRQKVQAISDIRDGLVKVNLGCGLRVAPGWMNIDGSLNAMIARWPRILKKASYAFSGASQFNTFDQYSQILSENCFIFHDLSIGLPFPDNSVDYIYSSHFFEHIFKDEAEKLLAQCHRALKPGGTIRIVVPDLGYAASLYSLGRKTEMLEQYFFVSGQGSYLARHKYMYDFELLATAMSEAGFLNVRRCSYRQGTTPDIELLDNYPDISLFVEADR